MDQLKKLLFSLSLKQRISIGAAMLAAIVGLFSFAHWNRERDFKPLYTGLSQEDAAAVLAKVREGGSEFRISESGSSVLVPSAKVAELRLQLAAAGIPKSGRIGFELFDKTNFGTSDFAEQVNYHRALEGELERSVMAIGAVEQARVHITFPKESVFLESRQPAKASVLVKLHPGAQLSAPSVIAICQLMASAVEGLSPDAVSVVDMRGTLLSHPHKPSSPDTPEPDDAALEYRQKIERDLIAKISTTLEPVLGAEKFRAGVSVDCDFTSGEQSEETFDPTKSVMVTSQKTEDVSGSNPASGVPGTASNLPRPTSRPGTGPGTGVARRTENIAYSSSRVVRRLRLPQGSVKRMSVSILVDNNLRFEGFGPKAKRVLEPPSAEKLKVIHDLVAGVIGFSAERGDQLVIESLPFESTLNQEAPGSNAPPLPPPAPNGLPPWLQNALKNKLFVAIGAGGMLLLLILAIAAMVMLRRKKSKAVEIRKQLAEAAEKSKIADDGTKKMEAQLAEQASVKQRQEIEALNTLKLPTVTTKKAEVLTKYLVEESKKQPQVMAQIIRSWLNEQNR
jgi:flagellar M-ring protein FliF